MRFPITVSLFKGQLDIAAVTSVLFLLLIFVLPNSSLVFPTGVRLKLPQAEELPGITGPTETVAMDASNQLYYGNQALTEDELRARLSDAVRKSPEPLTLILQLDESANMQSLVRLSTLARGVGMRDVVVSSRPPLTKVRGDRDLGKK